MSLIFYLIKRALSRSFGQMPNQGQNRQGHSAQQNAPQSQNYHDVVETIWAGMTTDQLRRSFGAPSSRSAISGGEVWVYHNLNGHGIKTSITIHNNTIKNWVDERPTPPSFPAPHP